MFIFEDSLRAAPYNIGANVFWRFRNRADVLKLSKGYLGVGIYGTRSNLVEDQAVQIGAVGFAGIIFGDFHLSLGFGPNFNVKFADDANKYKSSSLAMVLNFGYNFADFD